MTLTTTRMLSPDAKPIFLDFEVDHIGDKTGTLPNVTQIGVYDPEKPKNQRTFHAYIKVSKKREIYAPQVSFTDEKSQVARHKFKEVWPELLKWVRDGQADRPVSREDHTHLRAGARIGHLDLGGGGLRVPDRPDRVPGAHPRVLHPAHEADERPRTLCGGVLLPSQRRRRAGKRSADDGLRCAACHSQLRSRR